MKHFKYIASSSVVNFNHSYTKSDFTNLDFTIRLASMEALGFPEESVNDSHWYIRMAGCELYGYTTQSTYDEHNSIRYRAFMSLGWKTRALRDSCPVIAKAAMDHYSKDLNPMCG